MDNSGSLWPHVHDALRAGHAGVLLCVVESIGSSPGRAGFKAFVGDDGTLVGSIGGGSMEQKLVTLARSWMQAPPAPPFLKRQVHQADIGHDRSGMICSGEQTVAFLRIGPEHAALIASLLDRIAEDASASLQLDAQGLALVEGRRRAYEAGAQWRYTEPLDDRPRIAIVGGGHVGLALSRTMHQLGFHVHVLDDRAGLNTLDANVHAHRRTIVDYGRIAEALPEDPELFVVLASFGYRTDEQVLRHILHHRFRYLGMLGSAAKVATLFAALRADGFTDEAIARVHAPIGLPILSRTPEEIAISIAAEIIRVKNA